MKKRCLALLLAMATFVSSLSGCGGDGQQSGQNTESTAGAQTSEVDELTALTLMEKYNTTEQRVTDDNYRTYYEVFVYSFYDSDGDGIGDLKGLTEKLDYINDGDPNTTNDLGCNGIWLMPIMPSPSYHKYDVIDYYEIDSQYGTIEDFKNLIAECDKRGINVIIDLVMNHSSSEHEWFKTASSYMRSLPAGAEPDVNECPYVDYYFFSKEPKGGYEPLSGTEWYYEGQFWSGMPDLNMGSEAVRAEFEAIVDYWLDLGVSGFRLDAAKEYYTGDIAKNVEVLTWFNDMVKSKKEDAFIVAEAWTNQTEYANYYESGVSCFAFAFGDVSGGIVSTLREANGASYARKLVNAQTALSEKNSDFIDSPFYTNHDTGRSAGFYATDYCESQVKMAQAMNLLMSGSAFLYYGEEIGMRGAGKDENKRAGMYWTVDENAVGMCDGPKDMEDFEMKYPSLEEQEADGNSIYHFVKQTILLRNQFPALSHGVVEVQEGLSEEKSIGAIKKTYDNESVLLVFNIANESRTIDLANASLMNGELTIGGALLTGTEDIVVNGTEVILPPFTVVVFTEVQ